MVKNNISKLVHAINSLHSQENTLKTTALLTCCIRYSKWDSTFTDTQCRNHFERCYIKWIRVACRWTIWREGVATWFSPPLLSNKCSPISWNGFNFITKVNPHPNQHHTALLHTKGKGVFRIYQNVEWYKVEICVFLAGYGADDRGKFSCQIHITIDSYLHFQILIVQSTLLLRLGHLFGSNILFGSCKVVMEKYGTKVEN